MRRLAVIPVVVVLITGAFVSELTANPDIGGDPIYTEEDYLSAGTWSLTVYSYVYDDSSSSLPGVLEVDPGEMLFMYLLDVPLTSSSAVHQYFVGNPANLELNTVGHEQFTVPSGYETRSYEDPYVFGYSGTSKDTIFTYFGDWSDPWPNIDPGEYSLVYYIAVSDDYGPVPGTANAEGLADTQFVPGPVCIVGFHHFARFAEHWLQADCNDMNNWCGGADLDYSGDVNSLDLRLFADEWVDYCPASWPLK